MPEDLYKSPLIKNLVKGLNPQQEKAVTKPFNRHCLVLAGAGCGKTSVLTKRVAVCAAIHCPQNKILALTFTNKAAKEMKERVVKLAGIDKKFELPFVTTFHGFGMRMLYEKINGIQNLKRIGFHKEPALLSQSDRLKIIVQLTAKRQRRNLHLNISQIDNFLAQMQVGRKKLLLQSKEIQGFISELAEQFHNRKIEKNLWEFSDMIKKSDSLLSNNSEVSDYYRRKFSYILVDEFQDTNPLQISLLKKLISKENRLFSVGDDDQAIYGFRGADITTITKFSNHFPNADIVKLETNYRSTPAILSAANRIFRDKPAQYRKILRSGKYGSTKDEFGRKPVKRLFKDQNEMVNWIAKTVFSIEKMNNIPVTDMALLFRINETLNETVKLLKGIIGQDRMPALLTVHGSKGLEFPVVFLCDLEETFFPHYRLMKSQQINTWFDLLKRLVAGKKENVKLCDFDEEKRLFYVGVTRAERFLFLLSVKAKNRHGRKVKLMQSRFIKLL